MKILSVKPVSELEIRQVKDILRQSRCPNESLRNTFDRFTELTPDFIFFDVGEHVYTYDLEDES